MRPSSEWISSDYNYWVDILENISLTEQHNILVFQPIYYKFETQEGRVSGPGVFYKITAVFIYAGVAVISKPIFHE